MRRVLALAVALAASMGWVSTATAAWHPGGSGSSASRAKTMPAGNQPTASVSNRDVTVSWTQSTFAGGTAVSGYNVKRYDANGNLQSIGSGCSGTVSAVSCTENAVPAGTWKYSVTPRQGGWSGTESAQSTSVTVAAAALSFTSSTTVTSLPTTLNGNLSNFVSGQTVTFRLDNQSTGTVLSSTASPSPTPASGSASITVTIPTGTSNGSHTVYAIGSSGDVASAAITVDAPIARSFTTSAWTLSDASSGTAQDTSDAFAAAGGPSQTTAGFQSAFSTSRYLAFDFNGPLRSGESTSGVNFNFTYVGTNASITAGANTCFYFEVRRISTGTVVATHGSASSPVDCANQFTFKSTTTSLPEVTSTAVANDMEVRVYMSNAANGFNFEDLATVTGSEGSTAFTLFRTQLINSATGTPTTTPWSLNASDGTSYATNSQWNNGFDTARYLKLTFPAYVPSAATGISATFNHSYKSSTSGDTLCYYFEVYNATTLIATHGSSSVPVSCNSTTSFVTNTVSLPEVNTVARANNLVVKLYAKSNNQVQSLHDLATVTVNYTG